MARDSSVQKGKSNRSSALLRHWSQMTKSQTQKENSNQSNATGKNTLVSSNRRLCYLPDISTADLSALFPSQQILKGLWANDALSVASTQGCPRDKCAQAVGEQILRATASQGPTCQGWDIHFVVTNIVTRSNLGPRVHHAAKPIYWHQVVVEEYTALTCRVPSKNKQLLLKRPELPDGFQERFFF